MIDDLYSCITSSVIKFGEDFRKAELPNASYVDWDEHAEIATLPDGDLCGPAGIGFTETDNSAYVAYSYGISTVDDQHLFRLRTNIAKLRKLLKPQTKVTIYDESGEPASWMVIKTPLTIAPVSKAQIRSVQFITLLGLVEYGALTSG